MAIGKLKVGNWIKWRDAFYPSGEVNISQILDVSSDYRVTYYVEFEESRNYPVFPGEIAGTPTRRQIIDSLYKQGLIKSPTKEELAIYLLEN